MSISRQEEIISVLWLIAALLAFNGGYVVFGWVLAFKAGLDCLCSIHMAVKEIAKGRKEPNNEM
jgi:hypothetical protein